MFSLFEICELNRFSSGIESIILKLVFLCITLLLAPINGITITDTISDTIYITESTISHF